MLTLMAFVIGNLVQSTPSERDRIVSSEERQFLRSQRVAKIGRVLAAIRAGNSEALTQEEVAGIPYQFGYPKRVGSQPPARFQIKSLERLAGCIPGKPEYTGINWYSVQWECVAAADLPWPSTRTAFQFDGLAIKQIQTTPGAPLMLRITPQRR